MSSRDRFTQDLDLAQEEVVADSDVADDRRPPGTEHDPLVRAFRQLAHRHLKKQRYAEAEQLFRALQQRRPHNASYMLGLGWAILKDFDALTTERLNEARSEIRRACTREPYNPDARYCMAICYLACGYHRRVLDELHAALRADPSHTLARDTLRQLAADESRRQDGPAEQSMVLRAVRALSKAVRRL